LEALLKKVQLVLAVHCHQPVGNFDSVFERATDRCYAPFLEVLGRHPGVCMGLHYSGPLLEWIEDHRPDFLDRLGELVGRGQVELLGGGFYEPMLSVLPECDAVGQLEMMREYLEKRFGTSPVGIWLTERVWEPELASLLSRAGVGYTLADDTHFFYAGMKPGRLFGYYVTEKAGDTVAVFPIDKEMRYAIPFRPAGEVLREIEKEASLRPRGLVYGDDGEKFGVWPDTYQWVFEHSWLEDFFTALEESNIVEAMAPKTFLDRHPSSGRVYLPTASYQEMLTWAMPTEAIARYEDLKEELERAGLSSKAEGFIRGGIWQNFMSKYAEANHLHKKMLVVSQKLAEALADEEPWTDEHEEARRALYRGQCNCAYWHGLFGGLYLPHLRDAVYRQLIAAESVLDARVQGDEDWIAYDERDFDGDLEEEVIVENALMNVYLDPGEGGTVIEMDYRPQAFCLTNVLTRRAEGYHRHMQEAEDTDLDQSVAPAEPASIHDIQRLTEPGLIEKLAVDNSRRRCFLDRFPQPGTSIEDIQRATYTEEGDFLDGRYHVERIGIDEEGNCDFEALLTRPGKLTRDGKPIPLVLEKTFTIPADRPEIRVTYLLRNPGDDPLDLVFCPELNLTLLAGDDGRRLYEFEGVIGPGPRMKSSGEVEETSWFALTDLHQRIRIRLEFDPLATVWRHPVETISRSEAGFECIYQGSAVIPKWELSLSPGMSSTVSVKLEIQSLYEDAVVPA
jgi:hypothetical protein